MQTMFRMLSRSEGRAVQTLWAVILATLAGLLLLPVRLAFSAFAVVAVALLSYGLLAIFAVALFAQPGAIPGRRGRR
jgi:hypothetical protein